ncbi:type IV secretion system protein VirB5 [Sphingobium yanoikuyae]|uniref:Type IV secretion system protein VirB5 n=1 Tax=Sphingobium yanoikuyae TaxID=13690 RepID=A0A177JMY0_SPHYA|nr:type IV secretion system protein [Sphingobium yanoikuyae]OAH42126.1 type IV secretion system protein VirB5 [Sphingobium yanoikuyae]
MRRLKMVALALAGSGLMFTGVAHAQFGSGIVFDPSAFKRQLEELNEARRIFAQGTEQLNEAKALYRDLNKATDIGNVANQLKNDVLRTSDVSSSSLDGYTSGDLNVVGGLRGKANDVYQDLLGRGSQTMTAEQRAAYELGAREAAVTTGLAGNVGDAVASRREGLEELRGRLNSSTSAAERADMSARLQLEQAQMMNDQMGLQAIELQRRAKAEADYQGYVAMQQADRVTFRAGMGLD